MRNLSDCQDLKIFKDKMKGVKDDILSSNIQFGIIFMNWGKYKISKLKEYSLMNQIYESAVHRTLMKSENT